MKVTLNDIFSDKNIMPYSREEALRLPTGIERLSVLTWASEQHLLALCAFFVY